MTSRLKLVYAAGPGNVIGTYGNWKEGREDPSQVAKTYSGQFYDVVRELNAQALVIASHPSGETVQDGDFRIEHRPIPFGNCSGVRFHLGYLFSAVRLLWKACFFRADALVVSDGSCHWFPLRMAPLLGIRVIPTLHCVLWRQGEQPDRRQRFFRRLMRPFFGRSVFAILSASETITDQLQELLSRRDRPIYEFLPTYKREQFDLIAPPPLQRAPFRVFYAGRIERSKGVFELLNIAQRFQRENRSEIEFDLAGNGSALAELKAAVVDGGASIAETFRCHGHCDKTRMRELFSHAHVVIVPTTSDFVEGFNQVVAEGVLSGRPVITSRICPALKYVKDAVIEVPPDNTQAYGDAVLRMCDDKALYEEKVALCRSVQEQFYAADRGWAAALKVALEPVHAANRKQ